MASAGAPPSGTVTFLFTDVEGSARLWETHPTGMQEALERHDAILRSAIDDHSGYVFTTAGDAAHQTCRELRRLAVRPLGEHVPPSKS